jgi:hypothetical protein
MFEQDDSRLASQQRAVQTIVVLDRHRGHGFWSNNNLVNALVWRIVWVASVTTQ